MDSLEALVKSLPASMSNEEVHPIDVADLFESKVPFLLNFRKPTTPDMFALVGIIKKIQFQFPAWPNELCENIAIMALCYSEEGVDINQAWLLMAHLVERTKEKPSIFLAIKTRFMALFPYAFNLQKAEEIAAGE